MRTLLPAPLLVTALAAGALALDAGDAVTLRPLALREGVRDVLNPGDDPKKLAERDTYERARKAGVDLAQPQADPVIAHRYANGRLFYVFYKTVEEAFADRPYVIQRIKRTERNWASPDADPEETVTYQVEVFKLLGGAQKRADQHHGSYSLREHHRREVVKEYEIGFGEVPGECEGTSWPYDPKRLFEYVYEYGSDREVFDAVQFTKSTTWSLTVALGQDGEYMVRSSELGIDVPAVVTDASRTVPIADPASTELVLVRGQGLRGAVDADDLVAAIGKQAGAVVEDVAAGKSHRNVSFAARVIANIKADGSLNTLRTRPGFDGRTAEGARIGDTRATILELYGVPRRQYADAAWWSYGDIGFWFDGRGRVARLFVRRR